MAPLKRAMVVSYRLSIVTVALSVTIRPQFAIECFRRSNQHGGWVTLDPTLGVFPLEQTRHVGVAKSEHPRLTVKLISKNSNLCDHNLPPLQTDRRTDRQTDRQTTCDRNTALCTKVHRAVKTVGDASKVTTITNRKSHVRFLSAPRWMTLNGLVLISCKFEFSRNFADLEANSVAKRMKIDPYCQCHVAVH